MVKRIFSIDQLQDLLRQVSSIFGRYFGYVVGSFLLMLNSPKILSKQDMILAVLFGAMPKMQWNPLSRNFSWFP